jgi:hypothetical protein
MTWIDYVCRADHAPGEELDYIPMVTVLQYKWGWCFRGGSEHHEWQLIPPTAPSTVRMTAPSTVRMEVRIVATRLNEPAFDHAKALIEEGLFVYDERDAWSEHQPSAQAENSFIKNNGWREYARWHLGIEDEADEETKERYKFPYGDFARVHRCGVISAESRAGQYKHHDIEDAASHLHGMLDALRTADAKTRG